MAGSPDQMHYALNTIVASLPPQTKVYCGHEYTRNNLLFASTVEPSNAKIAAKLQWASAQTCTIPSTIEEELETNPFMRVDQQEVQEFTKEQDPIQVIAALRKSKNEFGVGSGNTKL